MSMISEFIKELRDNAKFFIDEQAADNIGDMLNDAADIIEELSEKLHASQMERSSQYYNDGWISVDERVPVNDDLVLVYDGDGASMMVAWYDGDDGEWNSNDPDYDGELWPITHWMPLPEKPTQKEGE